MRLITSIAFCGAVWAQAVPFPMVQDAYVSASAPPRLGKAEIVRVATLKDLLDVVVCKSDYDRWESAQLQKPAPEVWLYMDGRLMEGLQPASPQLALAPPDDAVKDAITRGVDAACSQNAAAELGAAEKDAADKLALKDAAIRAIEQAAVADKPAREKEAAAKTEAARLAAERVAALKDAAQKPPARYVFSYYLNAQAAADPDKTKREPWMRLLEKPLEPRNVRVSLGTANSIWPSRVQPFNFKRVDQVLLIVWAVVFGAFVLLFWRYARKSGIIRNPGPGDFRQRPYSLARTQMALWTFLVGGALAFIFMVTWNEKTITSGVLVLLGISFGTTIFSSAMRGTPSDPAASQAGANVSSGEPKKAPAPPARRFWTDLITEGDDASPQRFQMVLFTAILAIIFVAKTFNSLSMPEFDPTLLGLMGVSSGAYLGSKLQTK